MNTKKLLIIFMILFLVLSVSLPTWAVTNYQVVLKADKVKVNPGDTIKVTVSLSSINVSEGLGAFVGRLTYDKEIFEAVTQEDIVGAVAWGTVLYNPDAGLLAVERAAGDGVTANNDVMVITLRVKSDATTRSAEVKMSEINCSTGEEDLAATDVAVQISVVPNTTPGDNNNNVNNNTTDNTNNNNTNNNSTNNNSTNSNSTNNNSTNNNSTNNNSANNNSTNNNSTNNSTTNNNNLSNNSGNKVQNTAKTELPKAGQNSFIILAIIIVLLVAAISYINYKKMKNI